MSGAESMLMRYLGVFDVVDYILRKNVEADKRNVIQSLSQKFANEDVVLQTTAEEFYDMFHNGTCIMIPRGNHNHNKDVHSLAFDIKFDVINVVLQSESKLLFLEKVMKSYGSAVFSNVTITNFMRSAIDYSQEMM
jgi:hypothetical protein